jgi:hypothetical protein
MNRAQALSIDTAKTLGCAAALFAVNFYVCRELFRIEYLNKMGSIEAAFIGLARYIGDNFRDLTWFPLWYNGIPFQNAYPPLLHWTVALTAHVAGWSPALAYHAVVALLYCLAPVTLFSLCLSLSGSRVYSFFAGLIYSTLSPSAFILAEIRHEIGLLYPRRLQTLVEWGEGPHLAGLVLLPLAILMLHRAVSRRRGIDGVLCAVAFAATVMTNWIAAVALFAAVVAYICSANILGTVTIAGPVALLAYGMVAPWMPPSTVAAIRQNAPYLGHFGSVYANMPRNLAILGIVFVILAAAIRKWSTSIAVRFSAIFSFLMAALVVPASYWNLYVVPQADRYHLEVELGLAILVPFAIRPLLLRAPRWIEIALAAVALLGAVVAVRSDRRVARYLINPIDIRQTIEYKTAEWFDGNLHGQRVFAPGSTAFWLNAFTDTPLLGGGFDNGVVDQSNRIAQYEISSGDGAGPRDADISILWLKAMGVHAVAVGGPHTTQAFKDFRNPNKFNGVLPMVWHAGDDSVYLVPTHSTSLARVVSRADLPGRMPVNGIDIEPLLAYVSALDNPVAPAASFQWTSRHSASIFATLHPGDVISVQAAYHPGWHARINGFAGTVHADGLGQMYVEPACDGVCSVLLDYDGGRELQVARVVCVIAWLIALAILIGTGFRLRLKSIMN